MAPRKRLGQLLTELHVIDEHQLQSALGHQKQWGGKLGGVLVQKGFCTEEQVVAALSQHFGMPVVRLGERSIDPRALKMVSRQIAEKLHVMPFELSGSGRSEVLSLAMSDPTDLSAVDQLAFHTGKRIKPVLCGDGEVLAAIANHYSGAGAGPAPSASPAAAPASATPAPAADSLAASGAVGGPAGAARAPAVQAASSSWNLPAAAAAEPFPRRVEPLAAPSGRAPAPYIPPPIPARWSAPTSPPAALEEIEPSDVGALPPQGAVEPASEPIELEGNGDADAPVEGLEAIAAHTQGGETVHGLSPLSDQQGAPSDAIEGLESEGATHEAEHAPAAWEDSSAAAWSEPAPAADGEQYLTEVSPQESDAQAAAAETEAPDAWGSVEDPLAHVDAGAHDLHHAAADAANDAPLAGAEGEHAPALDETGPEEWPVEGLDESSPDSEEMGSEATGSEEMASEEATHEDAVPAHNGWQHEPEAPPAHLHEDPAHGEHLHEGGADEGHAAAEPFAQEHVAHEHVAQEDHVQPASEYRDAPPAAGLSAADEETLRQVGVDPADEKAALRILAALLRVLGQSQTVDLAAVSDDVRAHLARAAADESDGHA